jgi:TonB family protein
MPYPAHLSPRRDRRIYSRRDVKSLSYIDLGNDNGGIVLNMSEGGLSVHSAGVLSGRHLPYIRFQLPQCPDWVQARGEIAWTSETKMQAGIQFIGLPDDARWQIREWIQTGGRVGDARQAHRGSPAIRIAPPPNMLSPMPAAPAQNFSRNPAAAPRPVAPAFPVRSASSSPANIKPSLAVQNIPPRPRKPISELSLRLDKSLDAPPQPAPRAAWRSWWVFLAFLSTLAVLSFVAGLVAGRGDFRRLIAKFSQFTAAADSTSAQLRQNGRRAVAGEASSGTSAVSAPPTQGQTAAPESASTNGRVTITSRMYVPVPTRTRFDTSKVDRLQVGALDHRVEPEYPPDAATQRVEGTVQLRVTIHADGTVGDIALVGGPALLAPSAVNAVRQWRYLPTLLDGKPVEMQEDVAIVFWFPTAAPPDHSQPEQ